VAIHAPHYYYTGDAGDDAPPPVPGRTSVVIVSWRVRELLRACLRSIAAHEEMDALEIWVVDNDSGDGSAAMLREQFPWARLVALDTNPGFAAANNVALRRATGDVLLLLNPDTELHDASITRLAAYVRAHGECGVVGPRLLNPDDSLQSAGFGMPTLFQVWYDLVPWPRRFYASRRNGRYASGPDDAPYAVGFPLGAALAVRRDVLDRVGPLDEGYGMYMEEPDLCARVSAAGWETRIVPAAAITHHGGSSTGQVPGRMFLALHAARRRFYARFRSPLWNVAARRLTRAGLVVAAARVWFAFRRGSLDREDCRDAVRVYGAAWQLWGATPPDAGEVGGWKF